LHKQYAAISGIYHKGTIILESSNLGGAKFTIDIPTETSSLNDLKNE